MIFVSVSTAVEIGESFQKQFPTTLQSSTMSFIAVLIRRSMEDINKQLLGSGFKGQSIITQGSVRKNYAHIARRVLASQLKMMWVQQLWGY